MGSTSSRKAEVTRRVKDKEVHFTESSDSDTSETETDLWSNLPPFPDTSNENGRTRSYHYLLKLLFVGNCDTGKTCLLIQYSEDGPFSSTYISTIGIDFKIRTITVDERKFKLQMWDTSGHERFRTITRAYYRGASGIFLVYNVLNRASFDALPKWISDIKENASPTVKLTLLGNKCELKQGVHDDEVVDFIEAKTFADEYGIPLFEVSAKDGTNVEYAVTHMVARIWRTKMKESDN